jgi:aminoglycoside phosphotransferase (APT) family kinase protein
MHENHDTTALSDRLISYLRAKFEHPGLDYTSPLTQLQGGYETSTFRFELDGAPDELSRPLVLRLYPQFYGPHNAVWESTVQNVLAGQGYPVAQAYLVCTDMSVLGGAFYIMDCLPGYPLVAAPMESVPGLLGKTHAELHDIDPAPLVEALHDVGITERDYGLTSRLANRPPEPERLSVCHGDFHPANLLYADGRVTGVLDWPGFAIADPAFDVANSLTLITIPVRHMAASMPAFASVDWGGVADLYLAAYRAHRPLDGTNLDYYRVRRCVSALVEGFEGQQVWQHPLIVRDLLAYILDITSIEITMPA